MKLKNICLRFFKNMYTRIIPFRSSRPQVFCKKGVRRNFTKFTGKHLYQSLCFNKIAGSTSSSSIHSNFWNWNAHSSSFCGRAATRCGLRRWSWTVSADCLLGGSVGISDWVAFCFFSICSRKDTSLRKLVQEETCP